MTFFGSEMAALLFHFLPLLSDSGQKDFVVGGLDKEDLWVKQKFQSINQRESPIFCTNGVRWENCVGLMERKSIFSMKLYNGGHFQSYQLRFTNKSDFLALESIYPLDVCINDYRKPTYSFILQIDSVQCKSVIWGSGCGSSSPWLWIRISHYWRPRKRVIGEMLNHWSRI